MERGGRGEVSSAIFTINVPFSCGESSGQYYIFKRLDHQKIMRLAALEVNFSITLHL